MALLFLSTIVIAGLVGYFLSGNITGTLLAQTVSFCVLLIFLRELYDFSCAC